MIPWQISAATSGAQLRGHLPVSANWLDAGFQHIVLGLPAPYPAGVAHWVASELINHSS
jgi:hypothetical protein